MYRLNIILQTGLVKGLALIFLCLVVFFLTRNLILTIVGEEETETPEAVEPSEVPSYVPEQERDASQHRLVQPSNWNSLTPWGEAINTTSSEGYVEIRSWEMTCEVNGNSETVVSGLENLEAGLFLTDPWYDEDENTPIVPETTEEGFRMPVTEERVTHWWLSSPRPEVEDAENCNLTVKVKISSGVLVSVGGDWWIDSTSGWDGEGVNNQFMGRSDWYSNGDGWQTIKF